jgi:hypothetical protein
LNKLQAHFKRMQQMATAYLTPEPYQSPIRPQLIVGTEADDKELFVSDMISLLDGPEQRAAEAELDQERDDLETLVKDLMRTLLVVDHIVTVEGEDGTKRTIVASKLMS